MRAIRPNATNMEIVEALKKQGISTTKEYVAELSDIARAQATASAKMSSKLQMITPVLERLVEIRSILWEIISDPTTSKSTRLFAIEKMMKADYMMQETVYNSGLLTKNLGEFGDISEALIDPEYYENATTAMVNFGLIAGKQKDTLDKLLAKKAETNKPFKPDEKERTPKKEAKPKATKKEGKRGTISRNGDTP